MFKLFSMLKHYFQKLHLIETNSENWRCWNKLYVEVTLNDTLFGRKFFMKFPSGIFHTAFSITYNKRTNKCTSYIKYIWNWTIYVIMLRFRGCCHTMQIMIIPQDHFCTMKGMINWVCAFHIHPKIHFCNGLLKKALVWEELVYGNKTWWKQKIA